VRCRGRADFTWIRNSRQVKRQLAYFGDTMNVAARLCDYCKTINQRLTVSGDLLRQMTVPVGLFSEGMSIALRGRQQQIETHTIRRHVVMTSQQNSR
jgi:class 3 adenylate cyclase